MQAIEKLDVRIRERLTAPRFEALLRRLHRDRESAAQSYELLRWQLLKFFQWNGCAPGEDLVDETFDRVAVILENRWVEEVAPFAWGVARNIRREVQRRSRKIVRISDLADKESAGIRTDHPGTSIHERIERERRLQCLHGCLQQMSKAERRAFIIYHGECERPAETRKQLAAELGVSGNALKVRMNRLRQKMQQSVKRYYEKRITHATTAMAANPKSSRTQESAPRRPASFKKVGERAMTTESCPLGAG